MASPAPLMPFLRPLGVPRLSTIKHFLRFSTSTPCCAEAQASARSAQNVQRIEDRNLTASRKASPSYPPPSMKSLPRPKDSRASHRTRYPRAERAYPTRHPTHAQTVQPKLIPEPVEPLPAHQCAPNLAYFITRTRSNELPVYNLRKRGGNMKLTRVKKIDGRPESLRDDLRATLGLGEQEATVNPITKHVVLKGHYKVEVDKFLRERMF